MATGTVHNEHIAQLFKQLNLSDAYIKAIQDAVYLLLDATIKDKDGQRVIGALDWLKTIGIYVQPDDIVAPQSDPLNHQYYGHCGWNFNYNADTEKKYSTWSPNWQKRFDLGKDILRKTLKKVLVDWNLTEVQVEATAQVCYYVHLLGDLRFNENLGYVIDVPKVSGGLQDACKLFGPSAYALGNQLAAMLQNVSFGDNKTEIGLLRFCEAIDKTLDCLFANFSQLIKSRKPIPATQEAVVQPTVVQDSVVQAPVGSFKKAKKAKKASLVPKVFLIVLLVLVVAMCVLLLHNFLSDSSASKKNQLLTVAPSVVEAVTVEKQEEPPAPPPEPDPVTEPEQEPEPVVLPELTYTDIHFVKDTRFFLSEGNKYVKIKSDMSEGKYQERLQVIAQDMNEILQVEPATVFTVNGYTADVRGYREGKKTLSKQRADRVKQLLVSYGVPEDNLDCVYHGGTSNWGDNKKEATKKPNRVVVIEIKQAE